jgi:hypothetical protein
MIFLKQENATLQAQEISLIKFDWLIFLILN